jgi:hypothetical protein
VAVPGAGCRKCLRPALLAWVGSSCAGCKGAHCTADSIACTGAAVCWLSATGRHQHTAASQQCCSMHSGAAAARAGTPVADCAGGGLAYCKVEFPAPWCAVCCRMPCVTQAHTHRGELYYHTAMDHLMWPRRWSLIKEEIEHLKVGWVG